MKKRNQISPPRVRGRAPCAGFSLVEATISMTLSVLLLGGMTVLYYGAAKTTHREEVKTESAEEARMLENQLTRDLTMVGLWATEDVDGDSNDITRDYAALTTADSILDPFEYANTYALYFTADINNDSTTDLVGLTTEMDNPLDLHVYERLMEWDRTTRQWVSRGSSHEIADGVEHLMFRYYDNEGRELPAEAAAGDYPSDGFTLSRSDRIRIAAVEIIIVTRSSESRNGERSYYETPDGWSVSDTYEHTIQSFMVRGRNLRLT